MGFTNSSKACLFLRELCPSTQTLTMLSSVELLLFHMTLMRVAGHVVITHPNSRCGIFLMSTITDSKAQPKCLDSVKGTGSQTVKSLALIILLFTNLNFGAVTQKGSLQGKKWGV